MAYHSNRQQFIRQYTAEIGRRVRVASIFLTSAVKQDISQPGTLRYHPRTRGGGVSKSQRTIYNFTHSRPGNPPFKQTGKLRKSIAYEVRGLVGRVGSNLKDPNYPYYLELGTRRMAARSYLRRALVTHRATLATILTKRGFTLPALSSNQFRSGHYGAGAAAAGYF